MSAPDNVKAVKAAYEAIGRGDFEPALSLMADDVKISGPTTTGDFRSRGWSDRQGFEQFVAELQKDWDRQSYQAVDVQGLGDWVISLVNVVSTHKQSKQEIDTTMVHVLRFKGDKCVEFHEHVDGERMAAAAFAPAPHLSSLAPANEAVATNPG